VEIFWLEIFANHYSELESIALSSAALVTAEKMCSARSMVILSKPILRA